MSQKLNDNKQVVADLQGIIDEACERGVYEEPPKLLELLSVYIVRRTDLAWQAGYKAGQKNNKGVNNVKAN